MKAFFAVSLPILWIASAAAAPPPGGGKGAAKIIWCGKFKDAQDQAQGQDKKKSKPVAVLLVHEGHSLSKKMEETLLADERMKSIQDFFVWLRIPTTGPEYEHWFLPECGAGVEGAPALLVVSSKGASDPDFAGLLRRMLPDPPRPTRTHAVHLTVRKRTGRVKRKVRRLFRCKEGWGGYNEPFCGLGRGPLAPLPAARLSWGDRADRLAGNP